MTAKDTKRRRLRLTVSGGLERFAEQEVRRLLFFDHQHHETEAAAQLIQLCWHQKGHSGSQLEVSLPVIQLEDVAVRLMACRFVEYVYLEADSIDFSLVVDNTSMDSAGDKDGSDREQMANLLEQIQQQTSQKKQDVDRSLNVWKLCHKVLSGKPRDIGFDNLPGELLVLPTMPDTAVMEGPTESKKILQISNDQEFVVNTIYTKAVVAKAVVKTFQQLVWSYLVEISKGDKDPMTIDSKNILWLDAGAGSGALLNHLPVNQSIGVDTHPQNSRVYGMDFFQVTREWLRSQCPHKHLCIISNPPFAERSRGDFSAITRFVGHAIDELDASFIGLIVPVKFARQRIWHSLGMNTNRARLVSRFLLPEHSFYDPSQNNASKHIQSIFLLFDLRRNVEHEQQQQEAKDLTAAQPHTVEAPPLKIHVTAKRDKGDFRNIASKDLVSAVVTGLHQAGVELGSEKESLIPLSAKINKSTNKRVITLELYICLNPRQPLALSNCVSSRISGHSLGWISTSVKPSVAYAMHTLVTRDKDSLGKEIGVVVPGPLTTTSTQKQKRAVNCILMINTMCGEGTIELESQGNDQFTISGDKSESAVRETAARLDSLYERSSKSSSRRPLVDFVIWDAQRLPLRSGIADALLSDLPIGGSAKNTHQEPAVGKRETLPVPSILNYNRCMAQAVRVMVPCGRAVLVSADTKALSRSAGAFNGSWSELWSTKLNLGGLPAKMFLMSRSGPRWKDMTLWVDDFKMDLSTMVYAIAREACNGYYICPEFLELKYSANVKCNLVTHVKLKDSFYHEAKGYTSHCYRIWFDVTINNTHAKILEKAIRVAVENDPPRGAMLHS